VPAVRQCEVRDGGRIAWLRVVVHPGRRSRRNDGWVDGRWVDGGWMDVGVDVDDSLSLSPSR
jgi:hypothetical protein